MLPGSRLSTPQAAALSKLHAKAGPANGEPTALGSAPAAAAPGQVKCVALALTVSNAWCQTQYEAVGKSFHNPQCKCSDPAAALTVVDPAVAAAAAANAAVAREAVISETSLVAAEPLLTRCTAIQAGITDDWCFNNCVKRRKYAKRAANCPPSMCACS